MRSRSVGAGFHLRDEIRQSCRATGIDRTCKKYCVAVVTQLAVDRVGQCVDDGRLPVTRHNEARAAMAAKVANECVEERCIANF